MTDTHYLRTVWGLVPAAGLSTRMGRTKQMLPFGDTTVVGTIVRTMLASHLTGCIVVTRSKLKDRLDLPDHQAVHTVFNDDRDSEMLDSIRLGVDAVFDRALAVGSGAAGAVLIVPGDMPAIRPATYRACLRESRSAPDQIIVAACRGHRGHPIILPLALRAALDGLRGGLRSLVGQEPNRLRIVETDDPGVLRDLDTPGDYRGSTA